MKTFLLSTFFAATSLSAVLPAPALAHTDPIVETNSKVFQLNMISRKNPMQVQVLIEKYRPVKVWVTLRDAGGDVFYRTTLDKKEPGQGVVLDFQNLVDGTYSLEVTGGGQTDIRKVTISTPTPMRMLAVR